MNLLTNKLLDLIEPLRVYWELDSKIENLDISLEDKLTRVLRQKSLSTIINNHLDILILISEMPVYSNKITLRLIYEKMYMEAIKKDQSKVDYTYDYCELLLRFKDLLNKFYI